VENRLPGVVCAVMAVDAAGALYSLAAPSLPADFVKSIDGIAFEESAALAGAVCTSDAPIVVSDITSDARWAGLTAKAASWGFRACWSSPILGGHGEFIGVLALYAREPRSPSESETALIAVCRELCEIALRRHEQASDHERRTNIDSLTRLPNRGAFDAKLARLRCDTPGSWALFVLDLDNLKSVNDSLGHKAGDDLIRAAGQRLAGAMAPDVAYRLGGDEFAVIIERPEVLRDLDAAAMEIFTALEAAVDCDGIPSFPPRASAARFSPQGTSARLPSIRTPISRCTTRRRRVEADLFDIGRASAVGSTIAAARSARSARRSPIIGSKPFISPSFASTRERSSALRRSAACEHHQASWSRPAVSGTPRRMRKSQRS
jgi:GGDEF domain-containing protein